MKQTIAILFIGLVLLEFTFSKPFDKNKTEIFYSDTTKLVKFPKSIGWINDFENDFTLEQITELDSIIRAFESKTTNQIAIVSIESIEPYEYFADYSLDLFNTWGIGKKGIDNGLLILFSKNLRNVRITTGIGTEKILNEAICKKVIDEKMLSNFKKSFYYDGVKEGLLELIRYWEK